MTDVTPLIKSNQMVIQSYSAAGFKISGAVYNHHVIVTPDQVFHWDGEDFHGLVALRDQLDVVLLGTGRTTVHPPKNKKPQGLHLEVSDTGAAARAYNALLADGRRVAAALILPL